MGGFVVELVFLCGLMIGQAGGFELADAVQVDRADSIVLAELERARAYAVERQWREAVDAYRRLGESSGDALIEVEGNRWVNLRDYCQQQLAAMPAEGLAVYRARVDAGAKRWYEDGIRRLDRRALGQVVDQTLASSWGDRALLALGELALESGDSVLARRYWSRILPGEPAAPRLAYPDTRLDPASIRARLVLASIFEGSTARAESELSDFVRLHPGARGRLGGRDVELATTLRELMAEPQPKAHRRNGSDWPTFAGNFGRNRRAEEPGDFGTVGWRIPIRHEKWKRRDSILRLAFFPAVWGDLAFAANRAEILAVDVATGKPAWGGATAAIYRDQFDDTIAWASDPADTLGAPRHTITIDEGRLFARIGSSVTGRPQQADPAIRPGALVCVDVAGQGRLLWKIEPENGWAFEGAPVAEHGSVFVGMRRSDVRPQAHVACFDAQTGSLRWRRFVCAAETPGRAMFHEATHNLLALDRGTLYYNANLGAIAAISADEGRIRWVRLYPRQRRGELSRLAEHWRRDLTPCLCDGETIVCAPADSPRIFGLDAATGQLVWQTGEEAGKATQLLGVVDGRLIAAGRRLMWIATEGPKAGRIERIWPEGPERLGFGRGVLAEKFIYWPTPTGIVQVNARTAEPVRVIDLAMRGATGGNVIAAAGHVLIATEDELIEVRSGK